MIQLNSIEIALEIKKFKEKIMCFRKKSFMKNQLLEETFFKESNQAIS